VKHEHQHTIYRSTNTGVVRASGFAFALGVAAAACSAASGPGGTQGGGGSTSSGGSGGSGGFSGAGGSGGTAAGGSGAGGTAAGGAGAGGTAAGGAGAGGTAAGGSGAGGTGGTGGTDAGGSGGDSGPMHWVGTWTASPYPVPTGATGNLPPAPLSNSVLRQVVHVSLGGSQIRVQFSNLSGDGPVTINSAHVAICDATPSVDSTIDTTTDTALAFSGKPNVTIAEGTEIWSDTLDFTVKPLGNVSITTAFGSVPTALTGHAGSRTTSYEQTNSTNVSAASMTSAQTVVSWYYISGMDVMANASDDGIVAMGDSLTDGRGTNTDMNDRWTDDLEVRLQGNAPTTHVAMMNMGIGGSVLVGTTGTAAQARFSRDVLGQSGVRYVIIFDGVNDIGGGASFASMQPVYASMISQAHSNGLLIYGATITPFFGNAYYTTATEAVRQQVNTYIRSGVFDGVLDFDAAVTNGATPPALQTQYDTWAETDDLHLNVAGYQQLANSISLPLFTK
jgi:lysophospholipase L1-like esterase